MTRLGDRDVASAHGRLQDALAVLRECWHEDVELATNLLADDIVADLRRYTRQAHAIARTIPAADAPSDGPASTETAA